MSSETSSPAINPYLLAYHIQLRPSWGVTKTSGLGGDKVVQDQVSPDGGLKEAHDNSFPLSDNLGRYSYKIVKKVSEFH